MSKPTKLRTRRRAKKNPPGSEDLQGERIEQRYVPLSSAVLWERNPKKHDLGGIISSIKRHGFKDGPTFDATLGAIVEGNGRATALAHIMEAGDPPPRGILVDAEGEWYLPMHFGIDAATREQAEAYGIDHNGLTVAGGDLGFTEVLGIFDVEQVVPVLGDAMRAEIPLATFDGDDLDAILHPPAPSAKTFGADAAEGVAMVTCPKCQHEFPK